MEEKFVNYLKKNGHFHRLMLSLKYHYERLGQLGDTLKITNATEAEIHAIEGVFGMSFYGEVDIKMRDQKWMNRLVGIKFEGIDFIKGLTLYFGKPLMTKQAEMIHFVENLI